MALQARFTHVNLVAADWRSLAGFYQEVLGCTQVPPERDLAGEDLAAGTSVLGARLRGVHLRLPGAGEDGPTLEIFQYDCQLERVAPGVNRPGFGHIAFGVADVAAAQAAIIAAGGRPVGRIVTTPVGDGTLVNWAYVTDPEGNVIELQSRQVIQP